jgi:hypothetical protein
VATPTDTELQATIAQAATEPFSATGDNGSATGRSLAELIEADRYLAGRKKRGPGFKMFKIVASGAR